MLRVTPSGVGIKVVPSYPCLYMLTSYLDKMILLMSTIDKRSRSIRLENTVSHIQIAELPRLLLKAKSKDEEIQVKKESKVSKKG